MRHLLFLGLFVNISCFEAEKETNEDDDNELHFEGDQYGDCFDEEDNDEDGLIDCDDPGCAEREVCQGELDTAEPVDTGNAEDTEEPEDTNNPEDTSDTEDTQDTSTEGNPEFGETIHAQVCMACHGQIDVLSDRVPQMTDEQIWEVMENGYQGMPPLGLTEEEMTDVLAFLRIEYPTSSEQ